MRLRQSFRNRTIGALVLTLVLAAACSSRTSVDTTGGESSSSGLAADSDSAAVKVCNERKEYTDKALTLRGAYVTTVADVVAWSNSGHPEWGKVVPDFEKNRADDEPLTACWVDGPIGLAGPPGAAEFNRALLVIDSKGTVFLQAAGYQATTSAGAVPIEIRRPGKFAPPSTIGPPPATSAN